MPPNTTHRIAASLVALALGGCTSRAAPLDAALDAPSATDAAPPPEDVACLTPPDAAPPGAVCIHTVRGRVTDLAGAPLGALPVTVCGPACYIGMTDADGTFEVVIADAIDPHIYFVEAHGRPDYATLYQPLVSPVPSDGFVTAADPLALPRYAAVGDPLPMTGGEVTAGGVTLIVPAGSTLQPTFDDVVLGDTGTRLRVADVPLAHAPPFAHDAGLVALWAIAPQELTSTLPMGLRVANTPALAAGAAVDFVAMGTSVLDAPVNAGAALVVASGHVSSDGQTVATDPGQGITSISWIGIRVAVGR